MPATEAQIRDPTMLFIARDAKHPVADRWSALVTRQHTGDVSRPTRRQPHLTSGAIAVADDATVNHQKVDTAVSDCCDPNPRIIANALGAQARLIGGKDALFGDPIDPSLVGTGYYVQLLDQAGPGDRTHRTARRAGYGSLKHAVLHVLGGDVPGADDQVYADFRCHLDYA